MPPATLSDLLHWIEDLFRQRALPAPLGLPSAGRGCVSLIGAGPGDPELLTLRGARVLAEADLVAYDNLVGEGILALARPDARILYVGKKSGHHSLPQDEINTLLIREAKAGHHVARLKGGDPFIFGRGGEELDELVSAGVPFEVIPGITAASGASAFAGIPLTHRDHAQSCVFVTGHLQEGSANLDWIPLARPKQTVVIYMGIKALPSICRELIAHGLPPDTPAAAIQHATTRRQRMATARLDELEATVSREGLHPPTLLIIGEVAGLAARLGWFDPKAR